MRLPPPLSAREIKAHADLAAIAGRYTRLRRAGRQFIGLCPLHSERHPSFYVHPERQVWFCFGCQCGGDVFDFVMLAECCDFRRALQIVAEFSQGEASGSEPRSGSRFAASEGDGIPQARAAGLPYSQDSPGARARILAALDAADRRLRAIEAVNRAASSAMATDCEPERGGSLLLEKTE